MIRDKYLTREIWQITTFQKEREICKKMHIALQTNALMQTEISSEKHQKIDTYEHKKY